MKQPTAAPKDSRLLFVVPIYRHSPEEYQRSWEKGLRRIEKWAESQYRHDDHDLCERLKQQMRADYEASNPCIHRFNDIVGFAEVYWNGGMGIEANYFFRPDGRTRFGKRVKREHDLANRQRFYLTHYRADRVDTIPAAGAERLKDAIVAVLGSVEETAADLKCWADTSHERSIARHLDIKLFLGD